MKDSYKTIKKTTNEAVYKDRGSTFYAVAFPINDETQIQEFLAMLRKKYKKANHHCYAWKLGHTNSSYRTNDDGEPTHSAGDPILGQINSHGLSDVLVVVSRVFGGTKLGIGGLVKAYREAAKLALQEAQVVEKTITTAVALQFSYTQLSAVMRLIKEQKLQVVSQKLELRCEITIAVKMNDVQHIVALFEAVHLVEVVCNR